MRYLLTFLSLFLASQSHAGRVVMEGIAATNNTIIVNTTTVKVGIGTASPNTKLDIAGDARVTGNASATSGAGMEMYYQGGAGNILAYDRSSVLYRGMFYSASTHSFYTDGNLRQTILTNGNVGIGTASPATKFHVSTTDAEIARFGGATAIAQYIRLLNSNGQLLLGQESNTGGTLTNGLANASFLVSNAAVPLQLGTNSAMNMTILSGGNVGIGTASPVTKAQVLGASSAPSLVHSNGILQVGAAGNSALNIGSLSGSPYSMWMQVTDISGDSSNYPLGLNPSGGNVGIGISDPDVALQVGRSGGTIAIGGGATGNGSSYLKMRGSNSTTNWQIATNDTAAGALEFTPSTAGGGTTFTTPAMVVGANSNVGVGTANPTDTSAFGKALDVNGTTGAGVYARYNGSATKYVVLGQDSVTSYVLSKTGPLSMYVNGAERMAIATDGSISAPGSVTAGSFVGSGAGLTGLPATNASYYSSGTANSFSFVLQDSTTYDVSFKLAVTSGTNSTNSTFICTVNGDATASSYHQFAAQSPNSYSINNAGGGLASFGLNVCGGSAVTNGDSMTGEFHFQGASGRLMGSAVTSQTCASGAGANGGVAYMSTIYMLAGPWTVKCWPLSTIGWHHEVNVRILGH